MRTSTVLPVVVAALLTACLADPLFGGQFEDGVNAFSRGDYETTYRLHKSLAEQRDGLAQLSLGHLYFLGKGIPQNYAEAAKWYRKAAEQGLEVAQYSLAIMYRNGRGVPQDAVEAAKWYSKSAEQGYADAQYSLAFMYRNGQGVLQDYAEATRLLRTAAEQGYAVAQYNLGLMYALGQGVPQDYVLAHMWFNLAASRCSASEEDTREIAVKNRDVATSKMTPDQIAEAQRMAREWKPNRKGK